jgi:RNA polymerase sigma-70 factor, ECF subfamily
LEYPHFSNEGLAITLTIQVMEGSLALASPGSLERSERSESERPRPSISGIFAAESNEPTGRWQELYELHADFVWRTLRRLGLSADDAKDALHEVFLVAHVKRAAYDPERGAVRAWLFGITSNVARSERRRARRSGIPTDFELKSDASAANPSPLGAASERASHGSMSPERNELKRALCRAVEMLAPEQRVVFEMYELEGQACAEIALELQIPVGTVYSRLHKAREDLRNALAPHARSKRGTP